MNYFLGLKILYKKVGYIIKPRIGKIDCRRAVKRFFGINSLAYISTTISGQYIITIKAIGININLIYIGYLCRLSNQVVIFFQLPIKESLYRFLLSFIKRDAMNKRLTIKIKNSIFKLKKQSNFFGNFFLKVKYWNFLRNTDALYKNKTIPLRGVKGENNEKESIYKNSEGDRVQIHRS
tara:strand:+ start:3273 stop:3809 length:537 start_codon:yes stop_codon:yes gene_type:complete